MRSVFYKATAMMIAVLFLLSYLIPEVSRHGTAQAAQAAPARPSPGDPLDLNAKAAVLLDADTGRLLYMKNPDQELPPASLTKMMTALITIEKGNLDGEVTLSRKAAETGESLVTFDAGEHLTRRQLLYALMLSSANGAAVALAESVSGSEENFVDRMNTRARQMGLTHTQFRNPHGLDSDGHYSSARDLAVLAWNGLRNPVFRQLVSTKTMTIPWVGQPWNRSLTNHNRLLFSYRGSYGIKTGYTVKAGNCLASAAERNEVGLIAVVLNSGNTYGDSQQLFDYGFATYRRTTLRRAGEVGARIRVSRGTADTVRVQADRDLSVIVTPKEKNKLSYKLFPDQGVRAPVKRGESLGNWRLYLEGQEISRGKLIAVSSVPRQPSLWARLITTVGGWLRSLF